MSPPEATAGDHAVFSVTLDHGGRKRIDVIDAFRFDEHGKAVEMRACRGPTDMHGF